MLFGLNNKQEWVEIQVLNNNILILNNSLYINIVIPLPGFSWVGHKNQV